MAAIDFDDCIHVQDSNSSPSDEIRAICRSGVQEEAFYVCDVDDIVFKFRQWRRLIPRVRPFYAVKCNDSQAVLSTLAALGTGFDCASKGEIDKVLQMGVDRKRIIFAHPAKPTAHVKHAAAVGVNLATFDNEAELHKMKSIYPACNLVLRIRCDADNAQVCLGVKYGCDAITEGPRLLQAAKDIGLAVVGVSFHVGSGCRDPPAFRKAISLAKRMFDVGREIGHNITLLDIGGGFPGDDNDVFTEIAKFVNSSIDEFFPDPDVKIISEPGCYFVASAFTLAANIHSKREILNANGDVTSVMYYINDGLYGSFFDTQYDRVFRGVPLDDPHTKLVPSSVWGPSCDGIDKVEDNVQLPLMELGSWLIYSKMGAYTLAMACTFNGLPIPKVHAVASRLTWLLLKERLPLTEAHFLPSITCGSLASLGVNLAHVPLVEVNGTSTGAGVLADATRRLSITGAATPKRPSRGTIEPLTERRRGSAINDANVLYPPDNCRRGSLIESQQAELGNRPVF